MCCPTHKLYLAALAAKKTPFYDTFVMLYNVNVCE